MKERYSIILITLLLLISSLDIITPAQTYSFENFLAPCGFQNESIIYGPNFNESIRALTSDDNYVYVGGNKVEKLNKSDMSFVADTVGLGGVSGLTSDTDYVYAITTPVVWKIRKSDMSVVGSYNPWPGYGAFQDGYCITNDDNYVYAGYGGVATGRRVWKIQKSDMTYVAKSPMYGGFWYDYLVIAEDANFVYAGGREAQNIQKLNKLDMSVISQVGYDSGDVFALTSDDTYLYIAGGEEMDGSPGYPSYDNTSKTVEKIRKSDMTVVAETSCGLPNIKALTSDDSYVYVGGASEKLQKIRKSDMVLIGESYTECSPWSYNSNIFALTSDDNYIYVGGGAEVACKYPNTYFQTGPEPVINLNTSETYSSIQDAIDDASPHNHIYIVNCGSGESVFYEDLTINIPLTIEGENKFVVINGSGDEYGWGEFIDITAEDVTITNLTLRYGEINLINANGASFLRNNLSTVHVQFDESDFCVFQFNNFTRYADIGIEDYSNNNTIYNNNFWLETLGWDEPPDGPFANRWNQTYPRGGNYWEQFPIDYGPGLLDIYSGPNQDILGSDGIWDEPYELGRDGNKDWYPLVNPIDFDNIPDPPIFSGMTPADGASEPYTTSSVSIDIEDLEGEYPIDWSITGDYVQTDSGTIYSPTTVTASLNALPYNTQIVWTVTATDSGGDTATAPYSFTTLPYSVNPINYVDVGYTLADPEYRKTHWDTLQGAIDTLDDGGLIYIAGGTYNENIFINKPCHLIGENNLTAIIQGASNGGGILDSTIEVSEAEYPGFPMMKTGDVVFENLTIKNEYVAPFQSMCLLLRYVGNIIVTNCIFQYGYYGINADGDSDNITIINCRFDGFHGTGIYTAATDTNIEGNIIENCNGAGIQVGTNALNTAITNNHIEGSGAYGVYINGADNTTVTQNEIRLNNFGIGNVNADNTLIYKNDFIDNGQQATDNDGGAGTRWNYTYPTGGNYWSDFDTPAEGAYDNYHGPGQNLTGGDGIVDENSPNPYLILGGTQQDNYPLMNPWNSVHCMSGDFYWSPHYPEPNQTVYFYESTCSQNVLESKWNFGDGTSQTTTKSSIAHSYFKPGYYNVTLTITDTYGAKDTTTKQLYVGYPPRIPPIQPPKYPTGFTVEEMYKLLKADKLSKTMNKVTIMVIDSGVTPRTYNGLDLSKITRMYDSSYSNGLDENGHGTWCCYAIAYILNQKAPNAQIISYKVFDANGGTSMEIMLRALDKAKAMHVDVVSLSAGASQGRTDDPLSKKCEELRKAGIIVIVAAGNSGPLPSTVLSPGVSDSVIAIAAEDPIMKGGGAPTTDRTSGILDLKDDLIEAWSSRGPVNGVYPKPDVTAPGESIRGPWMNTEKVVSGTSMATPFIAGGTAVIVAENRDTINKIKIKSKVPELYEQAIKETCYKKGNANEWGAGIVQFDELSKNFKTKLDNYIMWEQNLMCWLLLLLIIIIAIIIYYYYRKRKKQGKKEWWKSYTKPKYKINKYKTKAYKKYRY